MNKENILFGTVGLLAGLIIGFMFANTVNQQGPVGIASASDMKINSNMPSGHPDIGNGTGTNGVITPEIQADIDKATGSPNDFDAQLKAALGYYRIGRFDDSITFLKAANKLKPDDHDVIVQLGNTNFDGDRYEEAEKWYTAALAINPADENVRSDFGLTFAFRDPPNYDRAIQEFNRALDLNPNHIQTLQNLTVAYTKKGDATKAKATLSQLESVDAKNLAIAKLREEIDKMELNK